MTIDITYDPPREFAAGYRPGSETADRVDPSDRWAPVDRVDMPEWCTDEAFFARGVWSGRRGEKFRWPEACSSAQANDFRAGFVRGKPAEWWE